MLVTFRATGLDIPRTSRQVENILSLYILKLAMRIKPKKETFNVRRPALFKLFKPLSCISIPIPYS
jgi:DNA polymerase sigma